MLEKSSINIQSIKPGFFIKFGAAQFFIVLVIASSSFYSCGVNSSAMRTQIRQLQNGTIMEDTSYVYRLPFAINESHRLVQGYFSRYSHKNRAALDFKMKKGTKVFAARNGIVVRVKKDGSNGGWNKKYKSEGNYIVIQHPDGSNAGYWHLQHNGALVKVGDTITRGQLIGLSGKTGYAFFAHLHFLVWRHTTSGNFIPTATRFKTSGGIRYLRPYRKYRNN